ncbi:MAG: DUF3048 domain-containing protein [Patescibacteria group bacterium]|jgi:hypothetical protein
MADAISSTSPKGFTVKVKEFFKKNVWLFLALAVLVINAVFIYVIFFTTATPPTPIVPTPAVEEPPIGMIRSELTGEYIPEAQAVKRPYAIMVDNFPSVRPASGLSQASWVWETLVEGGVTRLMAVFQSTNKVVIGPVRSAREYFLPLASELSAVYVHSGGSPAALAALSDMQTIANADEFANGYAYYRRSGLIPPHNLFTTTEKLDDLVTRRGWESTVKLHQQTFSDEAPKGGEPAQVVRVDFSVPSYGVLWRWDSERKRYARFIDGVQATDRENAEVIRAATIVAEITKITPAPRAAVPDAVTVGTVGKGKAWFFRDGQAFSGSWEKSSAGSPTKYLDANGLPFAFARGPVWVEIASMSRDGAVTFGND